MIRAELSNILLRKTKDHRIGFVSITSVEVTADFSEAFVHVSILGDEEARKRAMRGIWSAAKFLRSELGKVLDFRHTPRLIFKEDTSLAEGSRIIEKLNKLKSQGTSR